MGSGSLEERAADCIIVVNTQETGINTQGHYLLNILRRSAKPHSILAQNITKTVGTVIMEDGSHCNSPEETLLT